MNWRKPGKRLAIEWCFDLLLLVIVAFTCWNLWAVIEGGLPHLERALKSAEIRAAVRLSLWTSATSTLLCMAAAIPCAYALESRHTPLRRAAETILELPLSLPYLVLGLCLLTTFSSPAGKALKELGIRVVFDPKGIVLAQLFVNFPFALHIVLRAFHSLDPELGLTAQVLGANRGQVFRYITLPLCQRDLLEAMLLTWSRGLGEFGATLMLVGVTRMKTETLPASIYLNISTGDNGMALASACLLLLCSLGIQAVIRFVCKKGDRST